MRFALSMFPVGLLIIPTFLVGQPQLIPLVGFLGGLAMVILALGSGGFGKTLPGGIKAVRIYALFAAGLALVAFGATLFLNSELPKFKQPLLHAQISMMSPVLWGGVAGMLLAAVITWFRRQPA